tara:strand:+ start:1218 stop:1847 length:630 start_codon:yes stop_codon:yes gene_type:complete
MKYNFPYWGPFVCKLQVEQEMVDILLEKGKESREKNLDHRSKLAGMIDNEYYYEDYEDWFVPRFTKYIDTYIDGVEEYHNNAFKSPPISWNLTTPWINYQKAKEYNPPHHHDGDLSFVVYLQVPDEIKKENEKMQGVHNNTGPGMINFDYGIVELPFSISTYFELPEVRDLYIFPAWLTHHVFAFKADVERISVSANIIFNYDQPKDTA